MTRKQVLKWVIILICLVYTFSFVVSYIAADNAGEGITLDPYMSVTVYRGDGSVDAYEDTYFEHADMGDILRVKIHLPEERKIPSACLFASVYQSALRLYYNDTLLYSYGELNPAGNPPIGNVLLCADIPDEAWGHDLILDCYVVEHSDLTKLNEFVASEARNRTQFLLRDNVPAYLLSVAILVLFAGMFFVLFCWGRGGDIRMQGLYLSAFAVSFMLWHMGYSRLFYVTSNNIEFCGMVEYVGIYFMLAPFCMFLCYVEPNRIFQRVMKTFAAIVTIIFIPMTILNFTTVHYHYARYLILIHIIIGLVALSILIEFIFVRCKGDNKRLLLRFGVIFTVFFSASDMLIFYFEKLNIADFTVNTKFFSSMSIYIFVAILFICYMMRVMEQIVTINEKEQLERMAYLDGMTGVANRRGCLDYIKKLDSVEDYTFFFFDVNRLKAANDEYGHDVGDQLISAVAQVIKKVFDADSFYGRYGGDEFIAAVHFSDEGKIKEIDRRIQEEIAAYNEKGTIPFPVEVAYGWASKSEKPDGDTGDVIQLADERMYKKKREMKKGKQ